MNFLYIFKDGTFKLFNSFGPDEIESVENGVLTILNLSDKTYYDPSVSEWVKIECDT